MIGRLSGTLLEKHPPTVLVDVGGVGYELDVPMSTFYDLPAIGQKLVLLVHQVVREDAHLLYGFLTPGERNAFRELIKVAGCGPRTALAVLSGMSVGELSQAIAAQESARLIKVPGIGKKTAERLLLELKGKFAAELPAVDRGPVDEAGGDVLRALLALGYSEREATLAIRRLPADVAVSEGIRQALRHLARP
ncbi:MAG: Holliday junction branch migration protein RuvA [Burkholderiaceae bacterium]